MKTITVKSHKRKGRIVRSHARKAKKRTNYKGMSKSDIAQVKKEASEGNVGYRSFGGKSKKSKRRKGWTYTPEWGWGKWGK